MCCNPYSSASDDEMYFKLEKEYEEQSKEFARLKAANEELIKALVECWEVLAMVGAGVNGSRHQSVRDDAQELVDRVDAILAKGGGK